jgi:hypothetical protein
MRRAVARRRRATSLADLGTPGVSSRPGGTLYVTARIVQCADSSHKNERLLCPAAYDQIVE